MHFYFIHRYRRPQQFQDAMEIDDIQSQIILYTISFPLDGIATVFVVVIGGSLCQALYGQAAM